MTCLEAQSMIIAYIDGNLNKDDKIQFLKHIQNCSDCKDELNIYYTMIEGMRQLDSNMPLSKDFTMELDYRIGQELKHDRNRRGIFQSSILAATVGVIVFLVVVYVNFLNLLHDQEQNKLKLAQGDAYYSRYFQERLFVPYDTDQIVSIHENDQGQEADFYEKVRQYNILK